MPQFDDSPEHDKDKCIGKDKDKDKGKDKDKDKGEGNVDVSRVTWSQRRKLPFILLSFAKTSERKNSLYRKSRERKSP